VRLAIVGNGVCAITAIREIRKSDKSVKIDVFSDEPYAYYPRPKLIDYIAGHIKDSEAVQYGEDWYRKQGVKLHLSEPVVGLKCDSQTIVTEKKKDYKFDGILLACGSRPFVPPIKGTDKRRVHTLRTMTDAVAVKDAAETADRQIIVGGGILGVELAAAIKESGGNPIVVTNISQLLPAQLDQDASVLLVDRLKAMGIEVLAGFTCVSVMGDTVAAGVLSDRGEEIKGDLVVMATGVKPMKDLAIQAGIQCNKGVKVDSHLQTSAPGFFAAGDCIEWNGAALGIIPVALDTAKVAAKNMIRLGSAEYTGTVPSNTLQVVGIDLTSMGMFNAAPPEYESTVLSNPSKGTYFKAVMKDHVVVGGIVLGDRKVALRLRQLVSSKENVAGMGQAIFRT